MWVCSDAVKAWLLSGAHCGMQSAGQLSTSDTADVVNVLVTTGQLVPTLGKLLLFKLDGAFKATCKSMIVMFWHASTCSLGQHSCILT